MTREEAIERAARAINARSPRQRALGVSDGPTADEILMGYLSRDDRADGDGYFRLAREAARRAREAVTRPAADSDDSDPALEPPRRAPEKRAKPAEAPDRPPAREPARRTRERTMRPAAEAERRGRKDVEPRQPRPERSNPGLRTLLEACDRWEEDEPQRKAI